MSATKKTVALTGSSGTMGFQGFLELYARKDEFNLVLLNLDTPAARKKFKKYENSNRTHRRSPDRPGK